MIGSSNLSTSVPRDFKSVVSQHCPQEAVNTGSYPRIITSIASRINTSKSSLIHALTLASSRINTSKVWPAAQRTQGFWRASYIFFLYFSYLIKVNPLFAPPARRTTRD